MSGTVPIVPAPRPEDGGAIPFPGAAPYGSPPDERASVPRSVGAALAGAVAAAVLGTVLHLHIFYVGSIGLPLGAVAALVLTGSIALYVGLWSGRTWIAGLTGVLAYLLVGVFASGGEDSVLIAAQIIDGPGQAAGIAGMIWILGISVATVIAALLASRTLRRR